MTKERVLGFKEDECKRVANDTLEGSNTRWLIGYIVTTDKLVPVVSLQALKEYCELRQRSFRNAEGDYGRGVRNALKYLLSWAENQVGGEQKK